jgi:glycosyltransferase involved in cell wall biosynthesis
VRYDLELLKKHFDVKVVDFNLNFRGDPLSTVATLFWIGYGTFWADLTFSWFADIHALWAVRLSKIFGKKSVVVVGGYEVAMKPEIGYGAALNQRKARAIRYVLNNASKVLAVDDSLKTDAIKNLGADGKNIQTIHTGHDYEKFKPRGEKERLILAVGFMGYEGPRRKGLDVFVKAAHHLSDVDFVLVGGSSDNSMQDLKKMASPNVCFAGVLSHDELIKFYQRAKVYCQLSLHEGLPSALCEAMLCECVPVGTRIGGVSTAMGNTGFYVPYGDSLATARAIEKALISDKGMDARERIKSMFPLERREKELLAVIHALLT